jgi:hypothetical protein
MRALTAADIPTLPATQITGTAVITTDSRLSDTRVPTAGSVVDASIAAAAAISPTKIAGTAVVTTDTRLSDARVPTGAASGGLAGTYPNPTVSSVPLSALPVRPIQKKSANYTLLAGDWGVIVQAANTTQTLPDATAVIAGLPYTITNDTTGTNTTIATQAGQTVNGDSTWTMLYAGSSMSVFSDGTNWRVQ